MIKIRSKKDLLLLRKDSEVKEVYVGRRLSRRLVVLLLTMFPNLKRIILPRSVYELTAPRVLQALEKVGVRVSKTKRGPGRPPKYDEETLKLIIEKYKSGEPVSKISRDTGVPLRTVYHILRRYGLR